MPADGNADLGLIIGAKVSPDGSLDLSHALKPTNSELKISDPVVDRFRGPLVINQEKEEHYHRFQQELENMQKEDPLKPWPVKLFNNLREQPGEEIAQDGLDGLKVVSNSPDVKALADQYGYSFARPYFSMDLADYQKTL